MAHTKIDSQRCKSCRLCISVCPRKLIKIGDEINAQGYFYAVQTEDEDNPCTGCKICAEMCPDVAIEVYK